MKFGDKMTNYLFKSGKITMCGDSTLGSGGKGRIGSFITEHADNWQFACNAFSAQAGHTIKLDDGREYFYQSLNSCAYQKDKFEKIYIGPDAAIELPSILREYEENNLKHHQLGIHPLATIIQEKDMAYERGEVDFDGHQYDAMQDGTKKNGSTCHGTGPARVRKMLRRSDTKLARDCKELKPFVCNVSEEIMNRLDAGQAGFGELAQGFPLSLNGRFYPACTNRNVTTSSFLDGMMLPPIYIGSIILNTRTFPIRINSNKYIGDNGRFLTWAEKEEYDRSNKKYETYLGSSGDWYPDQYEITWDDVTAMSGSQTKIMEITSVTKLPRRVATFSPMMTEESIRYCKSGHDLYISINFMNYVDNAITGVRGFNNLSTKCQQWLEENVYPVCAKTGAIVKFVGTGPRTDDTIILEP